MAAHAHVVHHVPGRVRVHVPRLKGNPRACASINEMASSIPGLHSVDANPVTGSVVMRYDRHDTQIKQRLVDAMENIDKLLPLLEPELGEVEEAEGRILSDAGFLAGQIPVFAGLGSAVSESDEKLRTLTHGTLNLATVLPLLFAGCSYLLMEDKSNPLRNPMFLGGLVAMSLHSFVTLNAAAPSVASPD